MHDQFSSLAWEIIVVDDASPDGTQEVAKQLAGVYGEDKIVCMTTGHYESRSFTTVVKYKGTETSCRKTRSRVRLLVPFVLCYTERGYIARHTFMG